MKIIEKTCIDCSAKFDCPSTHRRTQRCAQCSQVNRGSISEEKRVKVWQKTMGQCWYCGNNLDQSNFCIDHSIPLAKGGSNALGNLLPSCRRCNNEKYLKTADEYRFHLEWAAAKCSPFTVAQTEWLKQNNIEPPMPPRHIFWGER